MTLAKKGFTLIELLVVIAIIGILAAIILPVYSQAKKNAYRSADMSNMNQLRTALGLYKVDQGSYPPALLGYVSAYTDATDTTTYTYNGAVGDPPATADILPANLVQGALFPKRVNALTTFTPALDRPTGGSNVNTLVENAVWPNGNIGTGDGLQRFGPTQNVEYCDPTNTVMVPAWYYSISGYDVANVNSPTGARNEIHYAPFWSYDTVPSTCPSNAPGSATDSPRQLGYTDPPETTVVTWDTFFRDYDANGNPLHERQDIVLFLGGDARPYDSANVAAQAWGVTP